MLAMELSAEAGTPPKLQGIVSATSKPSDTDENGLDQGSQTAVHKTAVHAGVVSFQPAYMQ